MPDSTFTIARWWLAQGIALAPVQPRSKTIVARFGYYGERITTLDQARFWFAERRCNLGLICGTGPAPLTVLDFDVQADYAAWTVQHPALTATRTDLSPRGAHAYFWGPIAAAAVPTAHVLTRAVVVAAPSMHPSGIPYRVVDPEALILPAPASWSPPEARAPKTPLLSKNTRTVITQQEGVQGDLLTQLKSALPILPLAESLTPLHSRDGRWYHGHCPWHTDRDPSFWVDIERGLWGCYACQVTGDVLNLYARLHGQSLSAAINDLARQLREGRL